MSGHNAARTLPPGDRDDVGLPSAPSTGTVAGPGQELQRTIENLIALRATLAAGNPYTANALVSKFSLQRKQATELRQRVLAEANGHAAEDIQRQEVNDI